jgi:phosphoenolpyruvate carboxylase
LQKHQRIKKILEEYDRADLLEYDRRQLAKHLRVEIESIWHSDELKRKKPTPVDEARAGIAVVENVLWNALPRFLRKLDDILEQEYGTSMSPQFAPIKVASWMGGDRDGNPNVTPAITREVSMMSRWTAATLFKADAIRLRSLLSFTSASDELRAATKGAREPYRFLLKHLEARLDATVEWANAGIKGLPWTGSSNGEEPMKTTSELMDPLMVMHRSLLEIGMVDAASGELTNTIRRVAAFGLSLLTLDIRQESTRHTEALTAITKYLGLGSYGDWSEEERRAWLSKELAMRRPLLPKRPLETLGFSPTVLDTLNTFKVAAELPEGTLGAYVISQCQQASDVMAVVLLQQDADVRPLMRVAPLFETLADLQRAPSVTEALFSNTTYQSLIQGKQEIMVGYSDSAKDAGRLAASWAQYNSQVAMMEIANKYKVDVTFFHGKGGTVGRGGNPALYQAILAHPPNTINGRFRVTEQGEVITQNFGQEGIAERTLDLFTAGVLAEKHVPRPAPKKEWVELMERLSETSCAAYRKVVREEPRFVPYFRAATPELELAGLNVGSRPAKRNPKGGVESLRAIPWVFAWTQTRLNLPAWLGVGEGLEKELRENPVVLKEMYAQWPWFRTLIDLVEMILTKSEKDIAANYDAQLVRDPDSVALGKELREKLDRTSKALLAVSGHTVLQEHNQRMLKSMAVRNPYVDPLNIIQAELLRRLRANAGAEEDLDLLHDALLITINGIANGMKNSG